MGGDGNAASRDAGAREPARDSGAGPGAWPACSAARGPAGARTSRCPSGLTAASPDRAPAGVR